MEKGKSVGLSGGTAVGATQKDRNAEEQSDLYKDFCHFSAMKTMSVTDVCAFSLDLV